MLNLGTKILQHIYFAEARTLLNHCCLLRKSDNDLSVGSTVPPFTMLLLWELGNDTIVSDV